MSSTLNAPFIHPARGAFRVRPRLQQRRAHDAAPPRLLRSLACRAEAAAEVVELLEGSSVSLSAWGTGKSSVGKKLAAALGWLLRRIRCPRYFPTSSRVSKDPIRTEAQKSVLHPHDSSTDSPAPFGALRFALPSLTLSLLYLCLLCPSHVLSRLTQRRSHREGDEDEHP